MEVERNEGGVLIPRFQHGGCSVSVVVSFKWWFQLGGRDPSLDVGC